MLSAWLPGGNWMLKVTKQDVHPLKIFSCSQRSGWVGQIFVGAGREHPVELFTQDAHPVQ